MEIFVIGNIQTIKYSCINAPRLYLIHRRNFLNLNRCKNLKRVNLTNCEEPDVPRMMEIDPLIDTKIELGLKIDMAGKPKLTRSLKWHRTDVTVSHNLHCGSDYRADLVCFEP